MTSIIHPNTHKTCKWFHIDEVGNAMCIANPPVATLIPSPNGPTPISYYPPVNPDQIACAMHVKGLLQLNG